MSSDEVDVKYAPFARSDMYGRTGDSPLPIWHSACLSVATFTLLPIRVLIIIISLLLFYIICRLSTIWEPPSNIKGEEGSYPHLTGWRRVMIVNSGHIIARVLLFCLGFYYIKETELTFNILQPGAPRNEETSKSSQPTGATGNILTTSCVVSNHISWVDILYHIYAHPRGLPSFAAKKEVKKVPLVGFLSKCMGCMYVDRETKSDPTAQGVSAIVKKRLSAAHSDPQAPLVLLFPEGTTTNGRYLLPFRTGAFLAGTPVLPVLLHYRYKRFSPAWETIGAKRHIHLMLCQVWQILEVQRFPVYCPSEAEQKDPKLFASNLRELLSREGGLATSDLSLKDKRTYHAILQGKVLPPAQTEMD